MNLLFVTDLHGTIWKYDRLFDLAKEHKADVVINGGDMLPKNGNLHDVQRNFIDGYLPEHFDRFNKAGIHYLFCLGNDDLAIFDEPCSLLSAQYPFVHEIAQKSVMINSFEFIGFNWVADYPFRLKDRCRMDTREFSFQHQFGTGLLSGDQGFKEIDDWIAYAKTLPTIAEELDSLVVPQDMKKAVYVMHMPPAGLGLDKCANGFNAGSLAVTEFIAENQPRLTLHGHIHESPDMTGMWKGEIGRTVSIQPGQMGDLAFTIVEVEEMNIERYIIKKY